MPVCISCMRRPATCARGSTPTAAAPAAERSGGKTASTACRCATRVAVWSLWAAVVQRANAKAFCPGLQSSMVPRARSVTLFTAAVSLRATHNRFTMAEAARLRAMQERTRHAVPDTRAFAASGVTWGAAWRGSAGAAAAALDQPRSAAQTCALTVRRQFTAGAACAAATCSAANTPVSPAAPSVCPKHACGRSVPVSACGMCTADGTCTLVTCHLAPPGAGFAGQH